MSLPVCVEPLNEGGPIAGFCDLFEASEASSPCSGVCSLADVLTSNTLHVSPVHAKGIQTAAIGVNALQAGCKSRKEKSAK